MSLNKQLVLLMLYVATFAGGMLTVWIWNHKTAAPASLHAGLTIERFTDLSELLVVRLDVSDVLLSSIRGRTGGVDILLLVKGDVALGVDLSAARFAKVDKSRQVAVLVLPAPSASKPRIDHDRTRTVLVQKQGLWVLSPGTRPYGVVVDHAMGEAETLIRAAGDTSDADHRARGQAERVLQTFFRSLDWTVQIHWADQPAAD
jgi:hypothetical protein